MSSNVERAIALLRAELRDGPVPARVILLRASSLGLNRDFMKAGKRVLGIIAIRDRDLQTGRTLSWRWSLPAEAPVPTPVASSRPPPIPHRWGVYAYNEAGHYYYKREEADTFKNLERRMTQGEFVLPLWILLTSAPTDAELAPLPIRLADDAIPALGGRWRKLDELIRRRRPIRRGAQARLV